MRASESGLASSRTAVAEALRAAEERPDFVPESAIGVWSPATLEGVEKFDLVTKWLGVYGPTLGQAGRGFYFPEAVGGGPGLMVKTHTYGTTLDRPVYDEEEGAHFIVAFSYEEGAPGRSLMSAMEDWTEGYEMRLHRDKLQWVREPPYGGARVKAEIGLAPGSYVAHLHLTPKVGPSASWEPNVLEVYGGEEKKRVEFEGSEPDRWCKKLWIGWSRWEREGTYIGTCAATRQITQEELRRLLAYVGGIHGGIKGLPKPAGFGGVPWWLLALLGAGGLAAWKASRNDESTKN